MGEAYYRIGQAAKLLGISSYHLRRLCELGRIEAEFSGHQWRPLVSAVETMQRTGVPPIPGGEIGLPETNGHTRMAGLLAAPSAVATGSAEEALMSEHALTKARNRLETLKLEREANEMTDEFAERERQADARKEARLRQIELEQQTTAQRRRWEDRKTEQFARAMRSRTWDIDKAADLDVAREVSSVLGTLGPHDVESFVRRQVDAAVSKALAPWRERDDTERAIREACDCLSVPHRLSRDDVRNNARLAAREAINQLRAGEKRWPPRNAPPGGFNRTPNAPLTPKPSCAPASGYAEPHRRKRSRPAPRFAKPWPGCRTTSAEGEMEGAAEQAIKPTRAIVEARLDSSMREHLLTMAG